MKMPLLCLVAFGLVGAACTDHEPVELHVKIQEQRGEIRLVHPGCECEEGAFIPLGERIHVDEVVDDCACGVDVNHCGREAHIETSGGDVPVDYAWEGSYAGGTLVFDGCDERIEVPIPSEYPAAPVVSESAGADDTIRVAWDVDATTESVTIWALMSFDFDVYRVAADAEFQEIPDRLHGVIANRPLEERETAIGRTTILVSTGGGPFLF